jgi:hypothetical protein
MREEMSKLGKCFKIQSNTFSKVLGLYSIAKLKIDKFLKP